MDMDRSRTHKSALAVTLSGRGTDAVPACVPFLPTALTGSLASGQPVVRGAVYCSTDFPWRAADWFRQEWAGRQHKAQETQETARRRVQPARAAKSKNLSKSKNASKGKRKREKEKEPTSRESEAAGVGSSGADARDYVLCWRESSEGGEAVADADAEAESAVGLFRQRLTALLEERRTMQRLRKRACASWACPLATSAPACAEMAYCLHGIGVGVGVADEDYTPAPEAWMELEVWPEKARRADYGSAEADEVDEDSTAHIDERTVEICGLRFAVDTCHGGLRVVMV